MLVMLSAKKFGVRKVKSVIGLCEGIGKKQARYQLLHNSNLGLFTFTACYSHAFCFHFDVMPNKYSRGVT